MKKNGFTLAEVLITLTIIGVIATMTLPALMTNTQEQQAKTALKKGINTLTEAAQLSQAIDGIDYATISSTDTTSTDIQSTPSLFALLSTRTQIDPRRSGSGKLASMAGGTDAGNGNYALFFRDGTALLYSPAAANGLSANAAKMQTDNLPYGIPVIFDTNGAKGPNIMSNCEGQVNGKQEASTGKDNGTITDLNKRCNSSNRVIKDQFAVRLRAGYAVPNSSAARWAFEN